ncbi:ABC transporter substrate-binding protein [Cryobacterium sp. SO2]|uniref:ABC transporter substrate-binding protein n=1 Tax=Cryobacterium sp. SO2 TaxID=1897060 RepID=UPI00223E6D30|nr:ABC transporter substrate-binding protein [Cryobacterium sp. SO2]WEO75967.1 ABC transporter substrate-binding protein [Cryobacterium sp. SO2]
MKFTRIIPLAAGLAVVSIGLAGCTSTDSLGATGSSSSETIVVGSQDYYSSEIIAEIYSQALESAGYTVERDFLIGQREVYVSEIESGAVDLFPEYTGPLLTYWEPGTSARLADEVYDALVAAAPDGLHVLDESSATDQNSFVVTREFAEKYGVTTIADLAAVPVPITLGGNSEGENRPDGPKGLESEYGVTVGFTPIEDGGGPLTLKALRDDAIQLAVIYTADPAIGSNDLVALEDPKGLFLPSHVVPIASDKLDAEAQGIINEISAALTPEGLIALNAESIDKQAPASTIAGTWLTEHL